MVYYYERQSGFSADPVFFPLTATPGYANLTFLSTNWNFEVTEWTFTQRGQWTDPTAMPPFQFRSISTNPDTPNYTANCWWMGPLDQLLLETNTVLGEMLEPIAKCHNLAEFYMTVCDQVGLIAERYPTYWRIEDDKEPLFVGTEVGNLGRATNNGESILCASNAQTEPLTRQYGNIEGISWHQVKGTADVFVWSDPLEGSWTLMGGSSDNNNGVLSCICTCDVPGGWLDDPNDQCPVPTMEPTEDETPPATPGPSSSRQTSSNPSGSPVSSEPTTSPTPVPPPIKSEPPAPTTELTPTPVASSPPSNPSGSPVSSEPTASLTPPPLGSDPPAPTTKPTAAPGQTGDGSSSTSNAVVPTQISTVAVLLFAAFYVLLWSEEVFE